MTATWNLTIRGDFDQWCNDKGTQMHARVWQLELWAVDDLSVNKQQVQIERARCMVEIAPPTELCFDFEQGSEHRLRRQRGLYSRDGVDKIGLTANANRR